MLIGCLRRIGRLASWIVLRGSRLLWPPAWTQHDLEVLFSLIAIAVFFFVGGVFYMSTEDSNVKDASELDLSQAHREKLIREYMKERGLQLVREDSIYDDDNIIKPDTYIDEIIVDGTRKPRYKIVDPRKGRELQKKEEQRKREEMRKKEKEKIKNRTKKDSQELMQLRRDSARRNPIDNQLEPGDVKVNQMYKKLSKLENRVQNNQPQPPLPPSDVKFDVAQDKMAINKGNVAANQVKIAANQVEMPANIGKMAENQVNMAANVDKMAANEKNNVHIKVMGNDGPILQQQRQQQQQGIKNPKGEAVLKSQDLAASDIKMSKYKKIPKLLPSIQNGLNINLPNQNASWLSQGLLQKVKRKPHKKRFDGKTFDKKGKKLVELMNKPLSKEKQFKPGEKVQSQNLLTSSKVSVYDFSKDIHEDYECVNLNITPSTKMCLYPVTQDVYVSYHIREEGIWEPHIVKGVQNELYSNPGIGLIDIGANIGIYSLMAANMGHKVLAIEPYIENIKHLHMAAKLNNITDQIVLLQNAVSNERRKLKLELPPDNQGGIAINKGENCTPGTFCYETNTILMDDLVNFVTFDKAIIKMDIEGHEHKAFLQAEKLFDKVYVTSIYMEWRELRRYYGAEITDTVDKSLTFDLVGFLLSHDYAAYSHVTGARLKPGLWFSWPDDIIWRHQLRDVL